MPSLGKFYVAKQKGKYLSGRELINDDRFLFTDDIQFARRFQSLELMMTWIGGQYVKFLALECETVILEREYQEWPDYGKVWADLEEDEDGTVSESR